MPVSLRAEKLVLCLKMIQIAESAYPSHHFRVQQLPMTRLAPYMPFDAGHFLSRSLNPEKLMTSERAHSADLRNGNSEEQGKRDEFPTKTAVLSRYQKFLA